MTDWEEGLIERLRRHRGIESGSVIAPNLILLSGPDTLVMLSSDRIDDTTLEEFQSRLEAGGLERYLVILDDLTLDLGQTPILAYTGVASFDDADIADNIISILDGRCTPSELPRDGLDVVHQLQEDGLLSYQTPAAATELLVNWATVGDPRYLLNPGHGTGQLLVRSFERVREGARDSDPSLWGIDTSGIACGIAKSRLGDKATLLKADYLALGPDGEQGSLGEFVDDEPGTEQGQSVSAAIDSESPTLPEFDAVLSHPPTVPTSRLSPQQREQIQERFDCQRLEQAFVMKSIEVLREGGHGSFLLPQSIVTQPFVENLLSEARIHGFVRLANAEFLAQAIEPVLVFLENRAAEPTQKEEAIRLIRIDAASIEPGHIGLLHGPADKAIERAENLQGVEMDTVLAEAFESSRLGLALSAPTASPFLFSDDYDQLSDVAPPRTGLVSGDNDFFYFTETEIEELGITEDLFHPVLRKTDSESDRLTPSDIEHHLLDLRELIESARADLDATPTIDDFIVWLSDNGYPNLARYIAERGPRQRQTGRDELDELTPDDLTDRVWNPDLVARSIFRTPHWWRVEIDEDIVFDTTMIGIDTEPDIPARALRVLLDTPLYRRLQSESMPTLRTDANYFRFQIRHLRKIPVIRSCLTEEMADRIGPLLPAETAHQEITIRSHIIQECSASERGAVDAAFEAFSQSALSWFLSVEQLRELHNRIENDNEPAEFLMEQFGEDIWGHLERMYTSLPLFENRREVLCDLIELLEEGNYHTFLLGLAPQFEGVLVDYLQATGGDVGKELVEFESDDGETNEREIYVYYPPGDESGKRKDLSHLLQEFFEGEYLQYLHETVREWRNQIAHGSIIRDPRRVALLLFVAFFGMSSTLIHRYNRYLTETGA